jgi:spermidine synthase
VDRGRRQDEPSIDEDGQEQAGPIRPAQAPRQVLVLGVGTGITADSALDYSVERVTAEGLIPEVLDLLCWFNEFNNDLRYDRRVTLLASHARRFVRAIVYRFLQTGGD